VAAMLFLTAQTTQATLHGRSQDFRSDARDGLVGFREEQSPVRTGEGTCKLIWSFDIAQVGSNNITESKWTKDRKIVSSKLKR